uniref:Riboflavin transporter n=1 Tax=Pseudonaja textilis TaxID=8673 RepID=A0A670ZCI5_PSETE
ICGPTPRIPQPAELVHPASSWVGTVAPSLSAGWNLPAYLSVLIALGNLGPVSVALTHRFAPKRLKERWLIHAIQALATATALLLALLWDHTVVVAGQPRSVAFLALAFLLALACCTSNVSFLPFMYQFPPLFIRTFFIGQGLSALLPCVLALGQGVGQLECLNATWGNASQPRYLRENFSAGTYFGLLVALLVSSALAFLALVLWHGRQEGPKERVPPEGGTGPEEVYPLRDDSDPALHDGITEGPPGRDSPPLLTFWTGRNIYLLGLLGVSNALTNGVLPSVQSYSCLPYGNTAFHLSVVFGNIANPVACFVAMFLLSRPWGIGGRDTSIISAAGCVFGAYLMGLAALSPCPPLQGSHVGVALVVLAWTCFSGLFAYLKVAISSLLHEAGHAALFWCGAVIQAGSLLGALVMFPPTSIYHLFQRGQDCVDNCRA